jgi:hypothetical protein
VCLAPRLLVRCFSVYNNNDVLRSYVTRVYDRSVNLSSEFRNAVEKLSNGRLEMMFVPDGAAGRYQVDDTHLHKPLKDYARKLARLWYTARMKALNQMRSNETSRCAATRQYFN